MNKSAYVRARVEPNVKAEAEAVFRELGLTASQVITLLYKQVSRNHDIPLELHLPNKETANAIEEARKGEKVIRGKSIQQLFDELDNEC